jgi:hypothetical protein
LSIFTFFYSCLNGFICFCFHFQSKVFQSLEKILINLLGRSRFFFSIKKMIFFGCDIFLVLILSNKCLTTLIKSQENWSDVKHNMMAVKFLKHESFVVIPPKFDEYILYC